MKSENQYIYLGNCIHCKSPIYRMEDKIRFTGKDCNCELEEEKKDERR